MNDLISRDSLLEEIGQDAERDGNERAAQILECILIAPVVEAAPVVHGVWVNLGFIGGKEMVGCPMCYGVSETKSDYCKDCGARMDGESNR